MPIELSRTDTFASRHIGPSPQKIEQMLQRVNANSLDDFIDSVVPRGIRTQRPLDLGPARGEHEALVELRSIAAQNEIYRSLIGMGYHDTIMPAVIQRNILENPGWYTQYTPYQAEIAQGRLEALLNFQTLIIDLTGLEIANAYLRIGERDKALEHFRIIAEKSNDQKMVEEAKEYIMLLGK